jgi:hypothetical protein
MSHDGTFEGKVVARRFAQCGGHRGVKPLRDLALTNPEGNRWSATKVSVVKEGSIHPPLGSTIGPQCVGDFQRATLIHEVACDRKIEPHDAYHTAYNSAMQANGIAWLMATPCINLPSDSFRSGKSMGAGYRRFARPC